MKNIVSIFSLQFSQKILVFIISIFLARYYSELFIDFSLLRSVFGIVDSLLIAPAVLSMYLSENKTKASLNSYLTFSTFLGLLIYLYVRFELNWVYLLLIISITTNSLGNGIVIGTRASNKILLSSLFLLLTLLVFFLHKLLYIDFVISLFSILLLGRFLVYNLSNVNLVSRIRLTQKSVSIYIYTLSAMLYVYIYREWLLNSEAEYFTISEVILQSGVLIQLVIGAFLTKLLIDDRYGDNRQKVFRNSLIIYLLSVIMFYFTTILLAVLYQEEIRLNVYEIAVVAVLPSFAYSSGYYYRYMLKCGQYKAISSIVIAALLLSVVCLSSFKLPFLVVMTLYSLIQGILFGVYRFLDTRGYIAGNPAA